MIKDSDYISLKWGTWKEWHAVTPEAIALKERYFAIGSSFSAMAQNDTVEQKEILCQMIDLVPGDIYMDWDGVFVSKDKAKSYIIEYRA